MRDFQGCFRVTVLSLGLGLCLGGCDVRGDEDSRSSSRQAPQRPAGVLSEPLQYASQAPGTSRILINRRGESCAAVTSFDGLIAVDDGSTLHVATCSNGNRYVIKLRTDDRLEYISSCSIFYASTGERC